VEKSGGEKSGLESYDDGYLLTAPVMQFTANRYGLYDLGGNVWEWCQDLYAPEGGSRVLRGGSWYDYDRGLLAPSFRYISAPDGRVYSYGFRCVVVMGVSSAP
jgi:formylglycine-generating enzyme required for sulfatase activity